MERLRFIGRVLPPSMRITMKVPSIHWEDAALGLVIDATLSITNSAIEVVCDSTLDDLNEVYRRVFDMARAANVPHRFERPGDLSCSKRSRCLNFYIPSGACQLRKSCGNNKRIDDTGRSRQEARLGCNMAEELELSRWLLTR